MTPSLDTLLKHVARSCPKAQLCIQAVLALEEALEQYTTGSLELHFAPNQVKPILRLHAGVFRHED
jgi:hypothetical protein